MKKLFYVIACACIAFASCTKAGNGENGPVIVNPDDIIVKGKQVLDPDTQKAKLEQIGIKFLNLFPATEYQDMMELSEVFVSHCDKYFSSNEYDWSELEDAAEDMTDDFYKSNQKNEHKWEYTYTIFLSNCKGTVTLGKRAAEFKDSDETKLVIEDVDGEDWVATLKSKNTKQVYLGEWVDSWLGSEWNDEDYTYEEVKYEDIYNVTVEIPSSLTFSVERNGDFFGEVTLTFDYSISSEGLDYNNDSFLVSAKVAVDDLEYEIKKASVNAETGDVECAVSLRKDGMFLFSQSLAANVDVELEEEDGEVVDGELNGASFNMEFNILGELQLKGSCSEFDKLVEIFSEEIVSEKDCERAAERASELLDLNVYYDCTSAVQASIEFEPLYDDGYYWFEPVIVFEDDSRYRFEKYFKERDFEDLLEVFEDLMYDYEDMLEDIYE